MYFEISLPKNDYSENVIRKALYWMSEHNKWSLNSSTNTWDIRFYNTELEEADVNTQFNRLLNDFKLRENLDNTTKNMRVRIIAAALNNIADNVK